MRKKNREISFEEALSVTKPKFLAFALGIGALVSILMVFGLVVIRLNITITTSGYLISIPGLKNIRAPKNGLLLTTNIKEGAHVSKGQILYILHSLSSSGDSFSSNHNGNIAIHSPAKGIVGYMAFHGGENVANGQLLTTIIPDNNTLIAKVFLKSSSIPKVRIGDRSRISYASYPYTNYGLFSGEIISISKVPISSSHSRGRADPGRYAVLIKPKTQKPVRDGVPLQLLPGTRLHASIIVTQPSFFKILFSPFLGSR